MKKENTPFIETERLILRKFTENDIDGVFHIFSDEEINTFLPWFPFQSIEETENYLHQNIFRDYEKEIAYRYAVENKATNRVIGYVSICGIDESSGSGEL